MACDICKKVGTGLVDLRDCYQTNTIKQICPDCERVVNKHLFAVQDMAHKMTTSLLVRFMETLKGAKP